MSPATQPLETLLPAMWQLADDIRGPGMSGNIRGDQLNGIMNYVADLQKHNAALTEALTSAKAQQPDTPAKPGRPKRAPSDVSRVKALNEILQVADEILQSGAELWGQSVPDAIEAWRKQQGIDMPTEWRAALAAALGGDAK